VPLLDPGRYRSKVVLLWNRMLVQSFAPAEVSRYWFGDPAMPLALASAVRFFFNGLLLKTVKFPAASSLRACPFL